MFKDKLNEIMTELNISQAQLVKLTGYSAASISQYISGKNVPTKERQKEMAELLGVPDDFFADESRAIKCSSKIPRLTTTEAGRLMGLSERTVSAGLRDGVFPWGYAIHGGGDRWIYFINAKKFAEIEGIEYGEINSQR